MIIGIDASNIRTGGGKNHLENFIYHSLKYDQNISFVLVSNNKIISSIKEDKRIKFHTNFFLNSFNFMAFISQILFSYKYFKKNKCDLVFVPGGIFLSKFKPFFTMSQNMLPYDNQALKNFSIYKNFKFRLMKALQLNCFKKSNGVIFLNDFARVKILKEINCKINYSIIPHGIKQQKTNYYNFSKKDFKILYVSDYLPYKHNYNVVKAISELILEGYNLKLTLIGKEDKIQSNKINRLIHSDTLLKDRIDILGGMKHHDVLENYKKTSLFLFASTCENQPIIILEAMSFGLPIISSNKDPMKSMVSGGNILFNSYDINSIKNIILRNLDQKKLTNISQENFNLSKQYIWRKNSLQTLAFFKLHK